MMITVMMMVMMMMDDTKGMGVRPVNMLSLRKATADTVVCRLYLLEMLMMIMMIMRMMVVMMMVDDRKGMSVTNASHLYAFCQKSYR